jgi:hypothetical protein
MKKPEILRLFVLLVIMTAVAACAQVPDPGNPVITYTFYGGHVIQSHAIQGLVVSQDKATLTITAADGNLTERLEKPLTKDQYNAIVNVFPDNNFDGFGDRYDEGQNYVADVGFTNITFTSNGKTKTVTTYNLNKYLPDGLVNIRKKLQETVEFTRTPN